ncbi:MAG: exo-alpha-sialidase, partial [Acidobacteria bacterium]
MSAAPAIRRFVLAAGIASLAGGFVLLEAQKRQPTEKPGPPKSGFYDFASLKGEFPTGVGIVQRVSCTTGVATQPSIYDGNWLVDCDAEVPHNETTIVVNPSNPDHAVGGYHSYQMSFLGATIIGRIFSTTSVTFDGGATWQQVVPPITPYQFSGDPALAFDANGRLYLASIADHEGPGGSYTAPSVVVARSDDGGMTWSNPVTVASGLGAVTRLTPGRLVFQDKAFIAVDASNSSPFANRAYVTWTSFQEFLARGQFR